MWFDSKYEQVHQEADQQKRQLSATKIPIASIDKDKQIAVINDYEVSLSACTCRDFKTRVRPCKHMYRLAYELGYLTPPVSIKEDPNYKGYREKTVKTDVAKSLKAIIDTVPQRAQLLLFAYLENFCDKAATKEAEEMAAILEDKGLLVKFTPPEMEIDELCSSLSIKELRDICPIIPKNVTKRAEVIQFISKESTYVEILKKMYDDWFTASGLSWSDYYWPSELDPYTSRITKFLKQKEYTQEDFEALGLHEDTL